MGIRNIAHYCPSSFRLIATPGRLLHVIVEMDLRLSFVQYVVFDEADRLFEMGFQDQLTVSEYDFYHVEVCFTTIDLL